MSEIEELTKRLSGLEATVSKLVQHVENSEKRLPPAADDTEVIFNP